MPVPKTEGLQALRAKMVKKSGGLQKDDGLTQSDVAALVGVRQSTVSGWLARKWRPNDEQRQLLELALNIGANLWRTQEERADLRRRKKAAKAAA